MRRENCNQVPPESDNVGDIEGRGVREWSRSFTPLFHPSFPLLPLTAPSKPSNNLYSRLAWKERLEHLKAFLGKSYN